MVLSRRVSGPVFDGGRTCGPAGREAAAYVRTIADGAPWDVVVVDRMGRSTCARAAVDHLSANALVILDDTAKPESRQAQHALAAVGMGRTDFWGFKRGSRVRRCTTAFSRDFNHWLLRPTVPVR